MDKPTPTVTWHAGERALQDLVGAGDVFAGLEPRIFHTFLTPQQREFFAEQPILLVGTVDAEDRVWASVVCGPPGFIQAAHPGKLRIAAQLAADDPAAAGWKEGANIALLGIDFATRRRFRINGAIKGIDAQGASITPQQVYGNCPKYIHPRMPSQRQAAGTPEAAFAHATLDARDLAIIAGADTFFVASYVDREDGGRQVDVSHRGGRPGFATVQDDGWLVVGDYPGNRFFNTMGNMLLNPRAGLLFIDFSTGDVLHIAGRAEVLVGDMDEAGSDGPDRAWRLMPEVIVRRAQALPLEWTSD